MSYAFKVKIERDGDIEALAAEKVRPAIAERSEVLAKIFEEAGPSIDPKAVKIVEVADGLALATLIKSMNDELSKLGVRASALDELDKAKSAAERWGKYAKSYDVDPTPFAPRGGEPPAPPEPKALTIGEVFVKTPELYAAAKGRSATGLIAIKGSDALRFLEQKATFLTSSGWAPESMRIARVILDAQREIEVTQIFPVIPTTQSAVKFMEETTFTSGAAERSEEAAYAASTLILTEQSETVRSIGTSLPVTDEQLEDVEGVQAYLDQRLGFMVRQRLDSQLMTGNAVAPNIRGVFNATGIQTQAKGTDPVPDAVYKAMDLVRVTGRAVPDVVLAHPNDWQAVRLLRTADGVYIWGSPSEAGPARIWGLPVVQSSAVTENTIIVGDFARFAALYMRRALELQVGFVNDDFTDGRVTIRAGLRAAAVFYRGAAFCKVTGV